MRKRAGLDARCGELAEQGFANGQFDAVVSSHVLEHVSEPKELILEMHRTLKPGGVCIVYTPNNSALLHRIFGANWRGLEPPRHLQLYSKSSLERQFASAPVVWQNLCVRTLPRARSVFLERPAVARR